MRAFLIICGAAIGAPARFAIDQYIRKFSTQPYGVFAVNIIGSFVLGLTLKSSLNMHAFFVVGFAGAFTTWSTFMLDFFLEYELRRYKTAALNLSLSLAFGVLAAWCGLQLAQ